MRQKIVPIFGFVTISRNTKNEVSFMVNMIIKVIGLLVIMVSLIGLCFAIRHLTDKLKTPKDQRVWFGIDVAIQVSFYPICLLGIIIGAYQFIV